MKNIVLTFLISIVFACTTKSKPKNNVAEIKKDSVIRVEDTIKPVGVFKDLVLKNRIHAIDSTYQDSLDIYDNTILSPKSAIFSKDGKKFYVNALEGYSTLVFDSKSLKRIGSIFHKFNEENNQLFLNNENTIFDYQFKQTREDYNTFLGKPVESCFSHNGKYLWVTYYRRSWDENAESPSAIAIIDTATDKIVRVMPSGPLPKMIACSPNDKYVAVTHWGDNTVGIIDISSSDVKDFKYTKHIEIDKRLILNYDSNTPIDRDNNCGNCLRGTIFTPDGKYILIAKMGGNGIGVVETENFSYLGTLGGMKSNLRHIIINNNELMLSSNKYGYVQKAPLKDIIVTIEKLKKSDEIINFNKWQSIKVGIGARTIDATLDGKYIFACVNNSCTIAVIESKTMELIKTVNVSKFPVGIAISLDGKKLIVTSQGKNGVLKSGNAVSVFDIIYDKE